ncbi:MAG: autotransporter outer membrane beta-barrel domain-containing protein, partial [Phycisphaeraceae bacterium]
LINVTGAPGTATLAAGSTVQVSNLFAGGIFGNLDAMTVITTVGGVTDNGATVNQTFGGVNTAFVYNLTSSVVGNNYLLTVLLKPITPRAAGSNNLAIAAALDADAGLAPAGSDFELIYINLLQNTTNPPLNAGLQQLSPTPYHAVSEATLRSGQRYASDLVSHLQHRRAGTSELAMLANGSHGAVPVQFASAVVEPYLLAAALGQAQRSNSPAMLTSYQAAAAGADSPWKMFGKFVGSTNNQDPKTDRIGFRANSLGAQFGVDKEFQGIFGNSNAVMIAGLAVEFLHTDLDLDQGRGEGDIDSFRIGPYASYSAGRWFADAALTFGYHLNDLGRNVVILPGIIRTANGDYDAFDISLFMGGGYDIPVGDFTITPDASIQYTAYFSESFTETGAGAANLNVDSRDISSLRAMVGVRVATTIETQGVKIVPNGFVGLAHEFFLDDEDEIDAVFSAGATKFTIDPSSATEDSIYYGTGVTVEISETTSAHVGYVGETSSDGQFHGISGGVTVGF